MPEPPRPLFVACLVLLLALAGAAPQVAASRLAEADSPYLRLHADDPVDWRPWGDAALAEARAAGKPLFLSIGYLACHWCHVMQDESFRDPETAALLNARFVSVLVDREARPDLDATYQRAAAVMGLPTGWPLNLFLTPDGEAFAGGLYFPPQPRDGLRGFRDVLDIVADAYAENPQAAALFGFRIMSALQPSDDPLGAPLSPDARRTALAAIAQQADPFHGGFGTAPKYPRLPALAALWRGHLRSGDPILAEVVTTSLEAMGRGGLYDHVGGGFFRYAVDPAWRLPHFEKMLDINAGLLALMTEVWRETRDPALAQRIRATVDFLLRELRLPDGGFGSALDADSGGREGGHYLWTRAQIEAALGDAAGPFLADYALADLTDEAEGAVLYQRDGAGPRETQAAALARLAEVRAAREAPRRDGKLLADWNAMAVAALAEAAAAFSRPDWLAAARAAYRDLTARLVTSDGLVHSWHGGRHGIAATSDDHAQLGAAALTLYEITGAPDYRRDALRFAAGLERFRDTAGGGYFQVAAPPLPGLPRLKLGADQASPSGNAAAADLLARLYHLTGEPAHAARAEAALGAFATAARSWPLEHAAILSAGDTLSAAVQIVIVGEREAAASQALLRMVWRTAVPGRVLQVVRPGEDLPPGHPARFKPQIEERATAYVCIGSFCSLPQVEPTGLGKALASIRQVRPR